MDNRQFDITSEGGDALAHAVRIAWPGAMGGYATHYKILPLDGCYTLLLLRREERDSTPLPYPLGIDDAITFVKGWLAQAVMGPVPDHDGDNGRGWRLFTEAWGHVAGHHYTILAAQPVWAMYGK